MIILQVKIAKEKKNSSWAKTHHFHEKHFYIHIIAVSDEEKTGENNCAMCVVRSGKLQISKQEIKKSHRARKSKISCAKTPQFDVR